MSDEEREREREREGVRNTLAAAKASWDLRRERFLCSTETAIVTEREWEWEGGGERGEERHGPNKLIAEAEAEAEEAPIHLISLYLSVEVAVSNREETRR